MKHYGDITLIKGDEVPVVDVVVGGSPCQDLSTAGKRKGLSGARSGLFMEQIRIIKEMRQADAERGNADVDIRPRYMVWENVPGAFSTNKGQDFAAVLEETIRIAEQEIPSIPVPEKGWATSGCILGDKWSVAWRVLDAQFWGTSDKPLPQRRRRIALVADFGGHSASEILFVRQSVSGNIEPSEQKRKATARDAKNSIGADDRVPYTLKIRSGVERDSGGKQAGKGALIQTDKSATLGVAQDQYLFQPILLESNQAHATVQTDGICTTLTASMGMGGGYVTMITHPVYSIESHPQDSRCKLDESGTVQTLTSRMGTGGGNVPMVMNLYQDKVGTLCAGDYKGAGNQYVNDNKLIISTNVQRGKYIVRRLTPLECERLQGYPDGWTDIGEWVDSTGKIRKMSDSARYKALGNSIAIPPWKWVMKRLCACYERDATLASLFDGIGGFPYIWEQLNGKGSCLWASEIEEFPIAVTKLRFGDSK